MWLYALMFCITLLQGCTDIRRRPVVGFGSSIS